MSRLNEASGFERFVAKQERDPAFKTELDAARARLARCDSVHREGKSWWRCARIAGHEGRHHFATKDWR